MELRMLNGAELRAAPDGKTISGYAAVWNGWSNDLGGFREKIKRGAFAGSLQSGDVICTFNHDVRAILGRTRSGTLQLREDSTGLQFACQIPDSPTGRDVYTSIARGDVCGCSFTFDVRKDDWSAHGKERTLLDVTLYEVGPVVFPAYQQTSVSARAAHENQVTRSGSYVFRRDHSVYMPVDTVLESERRRAKLRLLELEVKYEND